MPGVPRIGGPPVQIPGGIPKPVMPGNIGNPVAPVGPVVVLPTGKLFEFF